MRDRHAFGAAAAALVVAIALSATSCSSGAAVKPLDSRVTPPTSATSPPTTSTAQAQTSTMATPAVPEITDREPPATSPPPAASPAEPMVLLCESWAAFLKTDPTSGADWQLKMVEYEASTLDLYRAALPSELAPIWDEYVEGVNASVIAARRAHEQGTSLSDQPEAIALDVKYPDFFSDVLPIIHLTDGC